MINNYEINKKTFSSNLNYFYNKYNYKTVTEFTNQLKKIYPSANFKYTTVTD